MKVKGSTTKKGRRSSRTKMPPLHDSSSGGDMVMSENSAGVCTATRSDQEAIARGGVATPFPWKLHEMLEDAAKEGNEWIVSWQPHGHSFIVHKPKLFVEKIMPTYFNQSKFASFQRQLNLYGFARLTTGRDKGAYYHNCFVRGQVHLCRGMVRQKIKGTKVRRTSASEGEPDFYTMTNTTAPMITSPPDDDHEEQAAAAARDEEPRVVKTTKATKKSSKTKRGSVRKEAATAAAAPKYLPPTSVGGTPAMEEEEVVVVEEPAEQQPPPQPEPPLSHQSCNSSMPPLVPPVPSIAPVPSAAPPSPRKDVISAKERAHKLRQERLNAVRDVLKQTEMLCNEDDEDEAAFGRPPPEPSSSSSSSSMPTISIKPMIPSVSPLDSEVSDWEDDSSNSVFTPLRLKQKHQQKQKIPPMPPLTTTKPPLIGAKSEPRISTTKTEHLVPCFTKTKAEIKGGDVLFFEGKPFRYLEHLDSLPPPPTPVKVPVPPAPIVPLQHHHHRHPQQQQQQQQHTQKPKHWAPPSAFGCGGTSGFPRDSLQSLMRVDPQAIFNFNIRPMP